MQGNMLWNPAAGLKRLMVREYSVFGRGALLLPRPNPLPCPTAIRVRSLRHSPLEANHVACAWFSLSPRVRLRPTVSLRARPLCELC